MLHLIWHDTYFFLPFWCWHQCDCDFSLLLPASAQLESVFHPCHLTQLPCPNSLSSTITHRSSPTLCHGLPVLSPALCSQKCPELEWWETPGQAKLQVWTLSSLSGWQWAALGTPAMQSLEDREDKQHCWNSLSFFHLNRPCKTGVESYPPGILLCLKHERPGFSWNNMKLLLCRLLGSADIHGEA